MPRGDVRSRHGARGPEGPGRRDALRDVPRAGRARRRRSRAQDLADALGLHANTVRLHLERLREAGLVDVEAIHRGTVGRPQHLYSLARRCARASGFDPPAHALLAGLLAAMAERIGRRRRRRRPTTGRAWGVEAGQAHPEPVAAWTRSPPSSPASGFEPAADEDVGPDGTARIDFLHCPFRELAEAYPELVCNLHRGLCEGVVDQAGRGSVVGFSTLYEPDPCHVVVAVT